MFYGWRMVGVVFASHRVAVGFSFYALPKLMLPLAAEFTAGERGPVALLLQIRPERRNEQRTSCP